MMACGEVGPVIAAGMVMIGRIGRRMAEVEVYVSAVAAIVCSRGVVAGRERSVQHEGKRCRQRQAGREASRETMNEAIHLITGRRLT